MPLRDFVKSVLAVLLLSASLGAQQAQVSATFVDGEAQEMAAFVGNANRVTHDLWVETEFDSDGNGTMDRMHVSVTRPIQTDTQGLKVPVIYNTCLLYTSPSPRDATLSRMPSSA